jgi:uncharacterized protein involved in exopolysaccharide biosynthesis
LGLAVLTIVGVIFMPRTYQSEAKLFVRPGRENMTLDATATTGQLLTVMESRETEINSLVEVLKSRSLYERVVEEVGAASINKGRLLSDGKANDDAEEPAWAARLGALVDSAKATARTLLGGVNVPADEQAVNALEKMIEVTSPRKSNVIHIRCKAKSAELAHAVTKELLRLYRDEHARLNRTPGSYEFFQQQANLLQDKWQAATDKLRLAKNELGVVSIEGKRKMLQDQLAELELRDLTNRSELAASEARLAELQRSLSAVPSMIVAQQAESANGAFDGMRQTLYGLQVREEELKSKMNDNDPRLIALRQQVSQTQRILDDQETMRTLVTRAINPSRQALELELFKEQSQAEAFKARGESLAKLTKNALAQLADLNQNEIKFAELQRAVDLAEKDYRIYADKREQERITQALIAERISNVQVAQDASFVSKPQGPSKSLVLAFGLCVAMFGGLGTTLCSEYCDRTLDTAGDIRERLDLPLVATISGTGLIGNGNGNGHGNGQGNGHAESLIPPDAGPDDSPRPNHPR